MFGDVKSSFQHVVCCLTVCYVLLTVDCVLFTFAMCYVLCTVLVVAVCCVLCAVYLFPKQPAAQIYSVLTCWVLWAGNIGNNYCLLIELVSSALLNSRAPPIIPAIKHLFFFLFLSIISSDIYGVCKKKRF